MSFKDNRDLRPRGAGGFFWGENELWSVFAPLIGPAGVSVYMALCRLVPLAGHNSDRQISVRLVSETSCVPRTTCAEKMQEIFKLGMVIETRYLDGREPTYQLPQLRELAKLGQKELLQRIGVRSTDTAPFDQAAIHQRDRALRKKKRWEKSGKEADAQHEPMFTEATESVKTAADGVRDADTTQDQEQQAPEEPMVSATDVTVSGMKVNVSEKKVTVSAESVPLLEEEDKEKIKNPLPPAEQGEGGDHELSEPSLPKPRCTAADAGFDESLPIGTAWTMQELGITRRGLAADVSKQLQLRCRQHRDETLEQACVLMVQRGRAMHEEARLLSRKPWGWPRFIGEGIWQRPRAYAGGEPTPQLQVGMRRPLDAAADAQREQDRWRKIYSRLDRAADDLDVANLPAGFGAQLRAIVQSGTTDAAAVGDELEAMDGPVFEAALLLISDAELATLRAAADRDLAPYATRFNPAALAQQSKRALWSRMRAYLRIPSLPTLILNP